MRPTHTTNGHEEEEEDEVKPTYTKEGDREQFLQWKPMHAHSDNKHEEERKNDA